MRVLKAGVIGVGSFGEAHVATLKSIYGVEVTALSDLSESRVLEISRRHGVGRIFTDFRDLCALPDLDLVVIATPEADHVEPVLAAAAGGKHIFLEKPIASSVDDAVKIIESAAASRVHLMVGHILRFDDHYATVKQLIEQGALGRIVSIHARRNRLKSLYQYYATRVHGLLVNAIHDIDICLWYVQDRVRRVRAYTRNIQGGCHPDVNWGFLEFENGCVACLETHWLLPDGCGLATNDALQVIGTESVADFHLVPSQLRLWSETGGREMNVSYDAIFRDTIRGAIRQELEYFVECIRRGRAPNIITPEEALGALRVSLALIESAAQNREVELD